MSSQCPPEDPNESTSITTYGVQNMTGVFLVLYCSMLIGAVIMAGEWLISCYVVLKLKPVQTQPKTLCEALKYRWKRMKDDLIRHITCAKMSRKNVAHASALRAALEDESIIQA